MITDTQNKQIQIEARDINFILPAYIRQYLFISKNEDPEKIIFPMFPSVPHPTKPGVQVPIEWIPMTDPMVAEIAKDGKDIAEVTPVEEAALDKKDKLAKELTEETPTPEDLIRQNEGDIQQLEDETADAQLEIDTEPKSISPAKASMERIKKSDDTAILKGTSNLKKWQSEHPPEDRVPKQPPGGDLGAGHPDNLSSRDIRADKQVARDLIEEPAVEEEKEIPAEIEKPTEQ